MNKAPGVVVHPAPGHPDGTLVNALLFHCGRLSSGGTQRPDRPPHRQGHERAAHRLEDRPRPSPPPGALRGATIERQYEALCPPSRLYSAGERHVRHPPRATPKDRKRFTGKRGPRRATTHYRVVERFATAPSTPHTLETAAPTRSGPPLRGRLPAPRRPPLRRPRGGQDALIERVALHASVLGVTHPDGHALRFTADPPEDWQSARDRLNGGASWRA